ncbi:hypothetical protein D3C71_1393780 [compost metagenome]
MDAQPLEFGQQVVAALLEGFAAVLEGLHRLFREAGQGPMLGQGGRADLQAGGDLLHRGHHVLGHDHPAQAPARHVEVLREAVDDDDVVVQRQRGAGVALVRQAQVDFVDDGEAAALADLRQQGGELVRGDRRAGGVAGRGHHHALRGRCPVPGHVLGRQLEALFGRTGDQARHAAGCQHEVAVGGVGRVRHQHFAAAVDQRRAGQRQRAGCARGHDDAGRIDPGAEFVMVELRNGFTQRHQASGRAVAAEPGTGGALQRFHDLGGRGKVRFADAQADNVLACRLQRLPLLEEFHCVESQKIMGARGKAGHWILESVL